MFSRQATKRFSESVPPGESSILTTTVDNPATVEGLTVRFYQGPELSLQLLPFRERESDRLPLVDLIGRDVIVGDADVFQLAVSEEIEAGDKLGVKATNTNTEYAYNYQVDMTVDFEGGANRVLSSIGGLF